LCVFGTPLGYETLSRFSVLNDLVNKNPGAHKFALWGVIKHDYAVPL
jgi:hypothetical protein